jgi:hypothetical protein
MRITVFVSTEKYPFPTSRIQSSTSFWRRWRGSSVFLSEAIVVPVDEVHHDAVSVPTLEESAAEVIEAVPESHTEGKVAWAYEVSCARPHSPGDFSPAKVAIAPTSILHLSGLYFSTQVISLPVLSIY